MNNEPTLTSRVVRSAGWVMANKLTGRLLQLLQLLVLARLLTPEDFGVFGITILVIASLETFSQTGFKSALVQHKGETRRYLDTAWTIQVIRGVAVALCLFFGAPLAGWLFGEPRVIPMLRVMTASVMLENLSNVAVLYFQKELKFHKSFIFDVSVHVSSLVAGLTFAYVLRSPWALVWAGIIGAGVRCLMSYMLHPYRPRLTLDMSQAAELFTYGRWVFASSIVIFLVHHGDDILACCLLGPAALGLYQMAFRIANLAAMEISHTASTVMFPAYSKLRDNVARLREGFLKVLPMTMLVSAPAAVGTAAVAPVFVDTILGENWSATVVPMQILCLYGLLRSLGASIGPILLGSGNPKQLTKMASVDLAVMAVFILPATLYFGLAGTSVAAVAGSLAGQCYGIVKVSRLLGISPLQVLFSMNTPLMSAFAMGPPVYILAKYLPHNMPVLLLLVVAGVIIYSSIIYMFMLSNARGGASDRVNLKLVKSLLSGLRRTPDAG